MNLKILLHLLSECAHAPPWYLASVAHQEALYQQALWDKLIQQSEVYMENQAVYSGWTCTNEHVRNIVEYLQINIVYLDDLIILDQNFKEHYQILQAVFERLHQASLQSTQNSTQLFSKRKSNNLHLLKFMYWVYTCTVTSKLLNKHLWDSQTTTYSLQFVEWYLYRVVTMGHSLQAEINQPLYSFEDTSWLTGILTSVQPSKQSMLATMSQHTTVESYYYFSCWCEY